MDTDRHRWGKGRNAETLRLRREELDANFANLREWGMVYDSEELIMLGKLIPLGIFS
jgi:hypothetical protein